MFFKDLSGCRKKAFTSEAPWPVLNERSLKSLQCVPEVFSEVSLHIFRLVFFDFWEPWTQFHILALGCWYLVFTSRPKTVLIHPDQNQRSDWN